MSGTLLELVVASMVFAASHLLMAWRPIRTPLVVRLGEWGFRGLYSLISVVCLAWMITAYQNAPRLELFDPYIGMKHLPLSMMAIAIFFIVCGYTTPNPTAVGMEKIGLKSEVRGVLKITRHPVMWGTAFWAISHMVANGHAAALIFFGSLAFLAIAGASHIDARKQAIAAEGWDAYMKVTSHVPMLAILKGQTRVERGEYRWWQIVLSVALYAGLLLSHETVFGHYVMPF